MKNILILVLLGLATSITIAGIPCSCTQATNQVDCGALGVARCLWTGSSCRTMVCADRTDRSDFDCNVINGCATNANNVCASFTKCSDYSFTDPDSCLMIGTSFANWGACVPGDLTDSKYPCKDKPTTQPTCSKGTTRSSCRYQTTTAGTCYWDGAKCVLANPSSCSDLTQLGQYACGDQPSCEKINGTCVAASCSNIEKCTAFLNWDKTKVTVCGGTPCAEITSLSQLSATTCIANTFGTATALGVGKCVWTGSACRKMVCTDQTATSNLDCSAIEGCALTSDNVCASFTKCSDYSYVDPTQCTKIVTYTTLTCIPGDLVAQKYICKDRPTSQPICSSATSKQNCSQLTTTMGTCYWDGTKCVLANPTQCAGLTQLGEQTCRDQISCQWVNGICVAANCTNIPKCTSFFNWDKTQLTICGGTACAETKSLSSLSAAECIANTYGTAIYNGAKVCSVCKAFILFIFILAILF